MSGPQTAELAVGYARASVPDAIAALGVRYDALTLRFQHRSEFQDSCYVLCSSRETYTRYQYDLIAFSLMFLNHLYGGMDEPELKIIDVFICKLRKKLAEATGGQNYIETVWGRGYVLRDPTPADLDRRFAMGA